MGGVSGFVLEVCFNCFDFRGQRLTRSMAWSRLFWVFKHIRSSLIQISTIILGRFSVATGRKWNVFDILSTERPCGFGTPVVFIRHRKICQGIERPTFFSIFFFFFF